MKKAASAILLVFYFVISTGVVINLHYCMNRFDSAQFGASTSEVCGKCGMHVEDANACCHDEVKIVKLQDDQQTTSLHYVFTSYDAANDQQVSWNVQPVITGFSKSSLNNHSLPLSRQNIYLQNCVFRI